MRRVARRHDRLDDGAHPRHVGIVVPVAIDEDLARVGRCRRQKTGIGRGEAPVAHVAGHAAPIPLAAGGRVVIGEHVVVGRSNVAERVGLRAEVPRVQDVVDVGIVAGSFVSDVVVAVGRLGIRNAAQAVVGCRNAVDAVVGVHHRRRVTDVVRVGRVDTRPLVWKVSSPQLNRPPNLFISLVMIPRAILPRVDGSSPSISLPAIVPSIDSELS